MWNCWSLLLSVVNFSFLPTSVRSLVRGITLSCRCKSSAGPLPVPLPPGSPPPPQPWGPHVSLRSSACGRLGSGSRALSAACLGWCASWGRQAASLLVCIMKPNNRLTFSTVLWVMEEQGQEHVILIYAWSIDLLRYFLQYLAYCFFIYFSTHLNHWDTSLFSETY